MTGTDGRDRHDGRQEGAVTVQVEPRHRRDDGAPGRPRLAVAYDVTSSSPLELTDALDGRCDVVWVVDAGDPALGVWSRLLPRLGTVVDVAGRTPGDVADQLHSLGVAGVVAFTDSQLLTAALIGEALGLEGNPSGAVVALTDKVAQREALRVAGLAGPRFVTVSSSTTPEELAGLLGTLEFPAVIKPRRGSGSRDTERAHDRAEAEARLAALLAVGGCPDLIVEEWLDDLGTAGGPFADYVSVEAIARGGIVVPLAVTGKFPLADPCRETGNFLPHHLGTDEARAVEALAVRAAGALGVVSGALHIEVKLTPAGPRIIEVNGRIGGGGIDALYAMVHGRSLTGIAVSVALGEPLDLGSSPAPWPGTTVPPGGFAYACFLQAPMSARSLTGLGNLVPLQRLAGVEATMVNRQVGDTLDWRDGSQGYLVSVRGVADSLEALARVPADVESRVDLTWC
jgi:hypothetical protein